MALAAQVNEYIATARAESTLKAYRSDWAHFSSWCESYGQAPLPAAPETVAFYLTAMAQADYKASTIQRRLTAISQAHQAAELPSPTRNIKVKSTWRGIRRDLGVAQIGKAPVLADDLKRMVIELPNTLQVLGAVPDLQQASSSNY